MNKTAFLLIFCFLFLFPASAFSQVRIPIKESDSSIYPLVIKAAGDIQIGRLDSVPEYLIEARKFVQTRDSRQKSATALTLAYFYYKLENYDFSVKESAYAISLIENQSSTPELGSAYHLYALNMLKKQDFEAADLFFDKAETIFIETNARQRLFEVRLYRGVKAYTLNNYEEALGYFESILESFKSLNMPYHQALTELYIAKTLLEIVKSDPHQEKYTLEKAKAARDNAFALSKQNNFVDINILTYKVYSDIALLEKQYYKAFENYTTYSDKRDSANHIKIMILNRYLNLENREAELNEIITTQQNYLDQKKKSVFMNRMTMGLSILLIIILSLLILALYKNNTLRTKTYRLLQGKNDELTLAKERAEKALIAKTEFLSTITHELRTPMYAVTGLTQLLLEEEPREDQKGHLNSLKFSGEYLMSLINNILDLNKLEADKVELDTKSFNLKRRVEDILVASKKPVKEQNNELIFEYDDTIPNLLIGDPVVISQLLINLISNSVKFTRNGKIYIRIKKLEQTDKDTLLRFEIQDTGIGISPEKQQAIFENFTQESVQINRKYGGTGLGLSIVKKLLLLLNSEIHLESELKKGSKFWFELTLGIPAKKQAEKEISEKYLKEDDEISKRKNIHILMVEDNKINQMITKKILEKEKMECTIASTGKEAIELLNENDYDLILMDVHMPGMSGIEATQYIREFNKTIPIIALTAITVDNNLDDFYAVGFNEVIPKPFKTDDFFGKIYTVLS